MKFRKKKRESRRSGSPAGNKGAGIRIQSKREGKIIGTRKKEYPKWLDN